jgi:hypothetical protein
MSRAGGEQHAYAKVLSKPIEPIAIEEHPSTGIGQQGTEA